MVYVMHLEKRKGLTEIAELKFGSTYKTSMVVAFFPSFFLEDLAQRIEVDLSREVSHSLGAFGKNLSLSILICEMKTCQQSTYLDL